MKIRNHHQRNLACSQQRAGQILETLSSQEDGLWPTEDWPWMKLDKPLGIGAKGGHGPIRYKVVAHEPGVRVQFEFTKPENFIGYHEFLLTEIDSESCVIKHNLVMDAVGLGLLNWKLAVEPMHDALIEDAFNKIGIAIGQEPVSRNWGPRVKLFRGMVASAKKRKTRARVSD